MPKLPQNFSTNALLNALPENERARLVPELERVTFDFRDVLQKPARPIDHVYFPHNGVCSVTSTTAEGDTIELATIGREGMVGLPLVLNDDQEAHNIFVQVPGEGDRLPAAA